MSISRDSAGEIIPNEFSLLIKPMGYDCNLDCKYCFYSCTDKYYPELAGKPMPDGKPYRVLRSGNWYNGPEGHSRVSNRNPAHFRGPQDPNHPYYHIGFRIVRDVAEDGPRQEAGEPKTVDSVGPTPVSSPRSRPPGPPQGGTWRNPWRRGQ